MSSIIGGVKPIVQDKDDRKKIYKPIIEALEDADWDTQDECEGEDEAYDEAIREMHPDWYGED